MANGTPPSPTVRAYPAGHKLKDGLGVLITIALDTDIEFYEYNVAPPGFTADPPIKTTTHFNTAFHTFAAAKLSKMEDVKLKVLYDPIVYDSIMAVLNKETTITITFPDGATIAFYGYLMSFIPAGLVQGTVPDADITIVSTCADPLTGCEEGPVVSAGSGTACIPV